MRKLYLFILIACALASCREYQVSDDPSLRLTFSTDTVSFDTVFTSQGSSTAQVMVYNRNSSALLIERVWMNQGTVFRANVDGEPQLERLTSLQINGGDSLFVFIRVEIDPTRQNTPVLVSDQLCFRLSGGITQQIELEAYGQDVERIGSKGCGRTTYDGALDLTAEKPYLIYDTLVVGGTLHIAEGATLYMHNGACIYALGNVEANGSPEQPIVIRGDRLDYLFEQVPYHYAGGGWNGIYLQDEKMDNHSLFPRVKAPRSYVFRYVDILSGNVGLYCFSDRTGNALSTLTMEGCRIHNHTLYGLVLIRMNALVTNSEISNCASYCVYCSGGGHKFVHNTIASYFGNTNIRIQSVGKEDAAAVYIDNLSKTEPATIDTFYNCIITGYQSNQLVVATPFDRYYTGAFAGNYLKTDSLRMPNASANVYWQKTDTANVFRNDYYRYKEYVYYDFRLDSLSPAIGIGLPSEALPFDRSGMPREGVKPDAGCYQHQL